MICFFAGKYGNIQSLTPRPLILFPTPLSSSRIFFCTLSQDSSFDMFLPRFFFQQVECKLVFQAHLSSVLEDSPALSNTTSPAPSTSRFQGVPRTHFPVLSTTWTRGLKDFGLSHFLVFGSRKRNGVFSAPPRSGRSHFLTVKYRRECPGFGRGPPDFFGGGGPLSASFFVREISERVGPLSPNFLFWKISFAARRSGGLRFYLICLFSPPLLLFYRPRPCAFDEFPD